MNTQLYILAFVCALLVQTYGAKLNVKKLKLNSTATTGADPFAASEKVKCDNKTLKRMDSLIGKMMVIGHKSRRFPETAAEMRVFCNEAKKINTYFKSYAFNCFTDTIKRIIRAMYYPIDNEMKMLCRSGRPSKRSQELLAVAKCGNAAKPGLKKCQDKTIDTIVAMKSVSRDMMIPTGCCTYMATRECAVHEAEEQKECSKRTIDFFERYLLRFSGGLLNFACGNYMNNDRCSGVMAKLPKLNTTGYVRPRSFFMPAMDLMNRLPDFDF